MDKLFQERVDHFLSQKTIAIAGYSSDSNQVANHLYNKFEENGYQVFGINPKADSIKDIECFSSLDDLPDIPEAVMISTPPQGTMKIIEDCVRLGIKHAWIHCSFGVGSYNQEAVDLAEKNGIEIIPRGCPNMFLKADGFHKCIKWFMGLQGRMKIGV